MNLNMIKCSHIKRRSKFDPTKLFTQRLNVNENEPYMYYARGFVFINDTSLSTISLTNASKE